MPQAVRLWTWEAPALLRGDGTSLHWGPGMGGDASPPPAGGPPSPGGSPRTLGLATADNNSARHTRGPGLQFINTYQGCQARAPPARNSCAAGQARSSCLLPSGPQAAAPRHGAQQAPSSPRINSEASGCAALNHRGPVGRRRSDSPGEKSRLYKLRRAELCSLLFLGLLPAGEGFRRASTHHVPGWCPGSPRQEEAPPCEGGGPEGRAREAGQEPGDQVQDVPGHAGVRASRRGRPLGVQPHPDGHRDRFREAQSLTHPERLG